MESTGSSAAAGYGTLKGEIERGVLGGSSSLATYVPVPELKEKIASVTGILSEQQRLICRGRVLKDDQLLSAYYVEDGHTLHLVVRPPGSSSTHPAFGTTSSTSRDPDNQLGSPVLLGTLYVSNTDPADQVEIFSAAHNYLGITRTASRSEGIDLNQPPSERPSIAPSISGLRTSTSLQSDPAASTAVGVESRQPAIVPNSLTTMLDYLTRLRIALLENARGKNTNFRNIWSNRHDLEAAPCPSESRGHPTPEFLAEVLSSTRQVLVEEAAKCLSQLAEQLNRHTGMTDASARSSFQSNAMTSGSLFQILAALLLELGRAITSLRMGHTPGDASVNIGPAVFISSMGPNAIRIQPVPSSGSSDSQDYVPIFTRIIRRTGSSPSGSQPQRQDAPVSPNSIDSGQQDAAGTHICPEYGEHLSGSSHEQQNTRAQPMSDSTTQQQNTRVLEGKGDTSLPTEELSDQEDHDISDHTGSGSGLVPSLAEAAQDTDDSSEEATGLVALAEAAQYFEDSSEEATSSGGDEGIRLSNIHCQADENPDKGASSRGWDRQNSKRQRV